LNSSRGAIFPGSHRSPTDSNLLPQAKECSPVTQNVTQLEQRDSAAKEKKHSASIGTSVEEFVAMANSIDWQAVEGDECLYSLLTKARHELMYAAHLAIPMSVRSYAKQTYLITSSFAAVLLKSSKFKKPPCPPIACLAALTPGSPSGFPMGVG
jgi:hypothetical protein